MALSSGATVSSLRHYNIAGVSGDEEAPSLAGATSPTARFLLRKPHIPPWNSSKNNRSFTSSSPTIIFVHAGGLSVDEKSYSSATGAAAASASLCSSGSTRRRAGRRSSSSASDVASALSPSQHRQFFGGTNPIELHTTGRTPLLHVHNRSAGRQFECRAKVAAREGVTLDDVPHLSQWLPDLPLYENPLVDNPAYRAVRQYFVEEDDVVAKNVVVKMGAPSDGIYFRRAGPRGKVVFEGDEVRACIVTCGGLCPGLNTVIREIVCGLWTSYGVRDIIGIEGGYAGFYSNNTIQLNPKVVNDIHKRGGTILGTSRGGHDKTKIVAAILDRGINQVYIIGGDGTQKGAAVISEELRKLGVKIVVAGIPKTIDNDIAVIDKSFGFDTAVEEAQRAINAAHVEAESVKNGVGLVKLMGRYSGYIAMYATLASRDVDCCLIPEVPFYLEGEGGLYEFARHRLKENGHMVIVVAEGAGQELVAESSQVRQNDASGNQVLLDVGLWLSHSLKTHFAANKKEAITLKYIDPTYMVRAIPSNASDNVYCTLLAHSAMHGAMAGYTGFTVGPVNGRHAYIPIATAVASQNNVNVTDRMWARLLSSTQQPDFLQYHNAMEEMKKNRALAQAQTSNGVAPQYVKPTNGDGGLVAQPQLTGDEVLKKDPLQKS
ncbi:unnamed protein product [Calypogeia fissa]